MAGECLSFPKFADCCGVLRSRGVRVVSKGSKRSLPLLMSLTFYLQALWGLFWNSCPIVGFCCVRYLCKDHVSGTESGFYRVVPSTQEQYFCAVFQPVTRRQGHPARKVGGQRRHPRGYVHHSPICSPRQRVSNYVLGLLPGGVMIHRMQPLYTLRTILRWTSGTGRPFAGLRREDSWC